MTSVPAERYRADPGRAAATAWWKTRFPPPPGVRVGHAGDDPHPGEGERYFKLVHDLAVVAPAPLPDGFTLTGIFAEEWTDAIVGVIAGSYAGMAVDAAEVRAWRARPVVAPDLWVGAVTPDHRLVGSAIADFDPRVGEVALEWVQVLPGHRGTGLGRVLVTEILRRAQGRASFATVSGEVAPDGRAERLYRACGFTGDDVWHVHRAAPDASTAH